MRFILDETEQGYKITVQPTPGAHDGYSYQEIPNSRLASRVRGVRIRKLYRQAEQLAQNLRIEEMAS